MKQKPFYVTTPIYYTNSKLHIGHCYTTLAADALTRYKRLKGEEAYFLTGTDEHGQKIQDSAKAAGMQPKRFVDGQVEEILKLWKLLGIEYDGFIRTTDEDHKRRVQAIFQKLYDQGDIYKSEYEGHYCKACEAFWTESQQVNGCCPDCGRPVERTKEESYFFRLSRYTDRLIQLFEEHPEFIQPESRANEMLNNFLRPGLQDLAVSRTSFDWGIPVPFDPKHVIYVWIDALSNYITHLGYPETQEQMECLWPAQLHLVGKEIMRFHALVWPALLMALDLPLPKQIYGHGWILFKEGKMSKSEGNVVDPVPLCARYGVDAIRYFLLREVPFGSDGSYSNEALIQRVNADLANDLGNLLSRSIAMSVKYFGGQLPQERQRGEEDARLEALREETRRLYDEHLEHLEFNLALAQIWKLIGQANKYIDETMPWILAKDPDQQPRLAQVLAQLLETLRQVSILLSPFMPETAQCMQDRLCLSPEARTYDSLRDSNCSAQKPLTPVEPLFPRLDLEAELAYLDSLLESGKSTGNQTGTPAPSEPATPTQETAADSEGNEKTGVVTIPYESFAQVSLRVGKILSCHKVEGADKLLCEEVDLGDEVRTIVSGIAPWYQPEELVGQSVIVVTNLKPRKIRGVLSHGMLLAAETPDGGCRLLTVDPEVLPGAEVG